MSSQIQKIHDQLVSKKIACSDLIRKRLFLLKKNEYNSSNSILEDLALEMASKIDAKISNGEEIGLLEGIPFGIKDIYMLEGTYSTSSSNFLKKYKSPYTATSIQRLLDAGAIPLVKENCDSFGHGSSSENSIFGSVKNAIDPSKVAGGSSGGSAVNVAKNYTVFSIGSDTGGSIRQPAGYNRIFGLKPTYGRISRYGLMAYASSTDTVGPLAKSVEDICIVMNVMSGKDDKDQTSIHSKEIDLKTVFSKPENIKIGYFKNFIENEALCPKIKSDFLSLIEKIKDQHYSVEKLDFFDADILVATYYSLAMAEISSNLSRLDGMHYGTRIDGENLRDTYSLSRSEGFTEETKRRIITGTQLLSQGFLKGTYQKAQKLRNQIEFSFQEHFKKVDLILSPVVSSPIPKIGAYLKDKQGIYLSDAYTSGFSLAKLPTLSCPVGEEMGIQLSANRNQEEMILQFANWMRNSNDKTK